MASDDKTADYGEGDIEAKAMADAAGGETKSGPGAAPVDNVAQATGTTETDVTQNIRDRASREDRRNATS